MEYDEPADGGAETDEEPDAKQNVKGLTLSTTCLVSEADRFHLLYPLYVPQNIEWKASVTRKKIVVATLISPVV